MVFSKVEIPEYLKVFQNYLKLQSDQAPLSSTFRFYPKQKSVLDKEVRLY